MGLRSLLCSINSKLTMSKSYRGRGAASQRRDSNGRFMKIADPMQQKLEKQAIDMTRKQNGGEPTYVSDLKSPISGGTFRVQGKKFHLTYSGHIPYEQLFGAFSTLGLLKDYSFVHEVGDTEYKHTHCLVWFTKVISSYNPRVFDFGDIHPNIRCVTTNKHWNNILEYHTKEGHPYTSVDGSSVVEKIWRCPTKEIAIMQFVDNVRDLGGVIMAYDMKPDMFGPEPQVDWMKWQWDLYNEMVYTPPHTRSIIWYWDKRGYGGKTYFAKHMFMYQGTFLSTSASLRDIATNLQGIFSRRGNNKMLSVIFNFTKATDIRGAYEAVEALKDGLVTSEKYQGSTMTFDTPHVVVFANVLPSVNKISLDRWDIRILSPHGDRVIEKVPGSWFNACRDEQEILDKTQELRDWYEEAAERLLRTEEPPHQLVAKREALTGASFSLTPVESIPITRPRDVRSPSSSNGSPSRLRDVRRTSPPRRGRGRGTARSTSDCL